ncbi:MAG: hypothetical protein HC908_14595 [Calothrix sp. SM1_7_51]|nr:hypothetical protein [Calothrix sp. SM1_7_51]
MQLAVPPEPVITSSQNINHSYNSDSSDNPIPLWMVATVALCCASGCLIILRFIKVRSQPQKVVKTSNRYQARQSLRHKQAPQKTYESRFSKQSLVQQKPSIFVPPQAKKYNPQVFVHHKQYEVE